LAGVFLVGVFVAACGGKVDDPVGHAASDQQTNVCKPVWQNAGGGSDVGGPCLSMSESGVCGSTTYTVSCTCPGPCDCVVNGQTVDTAPTKSCSETTSCPPPDDAWKACGCPAVPGMP